MIGNCADTGCDVGCDNVEDFRGRLYSITQEAVVKDFESLRGSCFGPPPRMRRMLLEGLELAYIA